MTDEELEVLHKQTEATLQQFSDLEDQVAKIMQQKELLARQYGAGNFEQLVEASKRALSDEARQKNEREQAEFLERLQREARETAERAVAHQATDVHHSAPRRMRRMV